MSPTSGTASPTGSTDPDWPSTLDSVVVYASGAVCRRVAHGTAPHTAAGPLRLRLTGLPRSLDARSLRATVVGEAPGWRVTEVRPAAQARLREPEELPELRHRRAQVEEQEAALRALRSLLEGRITRTAALRAVSAPESPEAPHRRAPADAFLALADFVDARLAALHARAEQVREQLRQAEHELSVIDDELARASDAVPGTPIETSGVALLALTPTAREAPAGELTVELEYLVPGALWVPSYRLTHRRGDSGGTLLLRAEVAQRTGEDWTDVHLGFSTADLHRSTGLPRLRSIRIGRSQPPPPPSGWRAPPSGLGSLFDDYDRGAQAVDHPVPAALGGAPAPAADGGPTPQAIVYGAAAPPPPGAPGAAPLGAAPRAMHAMHRAAAPPVAAGMPGPAAAMSPAPPPPPPEAPEAPAVPAAALLDYAALTLAGPAEPRTRRGRLHPAPDPDGGGAPGLAVEQARRRAEELADMLALPAHAVRPRRSAGSFDHRYDAAARTDLPSDGSWHTVTIGEIPVSLRTEYVCVPSVDPAVYATLLLANDSDQALLAGPLEVVVDGDFLLTTALPTLAPGATRRVGLGVAESVRATRRTETQESTAGLRGSTTVVTQRVHVELANRLGHLVTVEVRERIPVVGDRDIRIEERPGSPAWSTPSTASEAYPAGTRLWRIELPPGGRAELDGGYEIRIPAGKALSGGNRRS